ncbi:MAG: signal transduction histidine kinase [Crocinitomicaceae bacterium]|jgi:signal transduction histidine kinase
MNVILKDAVEVASKVTGILSNDASKYCFCKKNAELAIHFSPKEPVILIRYYGIGISKSELPNLFQPFFRANNVQALTKKMSFNINELTR